MVVVVVVMVMGGFSILYDFSQDSDDFRLSSEPGREVPRFVPQVSLQLCEGDPFDLRHLRRVHHRLSTSQLRPEGRHELPIYVLVGVAPDHLARVGGGEGR